MQYHGTLITADGAYLCPVGSIWPFLLLLSFIHIGLVESQYSLLRQKVEVLEYAVRLDIEGAQLSINKLRIINNTWKQKRNYEIQWKH